jgi:signal recognition particle subunit SRP54
MSLLPRTGPLKGLDSVEVDEEQLKVVEAIIDSMTPQERRLPKIMNASRRRRVARGSGTSIQQVNQLLRHHRQMKKMMKQMKGSWLRRIAG